MPGVAMLNMSSESDFAATVASGGSFHSIRSAGTRLIFTAWIGALAEAELGVVTLSAYCTGLSRMSVSAESLQPLGVVATTL